MARTEQTPRESTRSKDPRMAARAACRRPANASAPTHGQYDDEGFAMSGSESNPHGFCSSDDWGSEYDDLEHDPGMKHWVCTREAERERKEKERKERAKRAREEQKEKEKERAKDSYRRSESPSVVTKLAPPGDKQDSDGFKRRRSSSSASETKITSTTTNNKKSRPSHHHREDRDDSLLDSSPEEDDERRRKRIRLKERLSSVISFSRNRNGKSATSRSRSRSKSMPSEGRQHGRRGATDEAERLHPRHSLPATDKTFPPDSRAGINANTGPINNLANGSDPTTSGLTSLFATLPPQFIQMMVAVAEAQKQAGPQGASFATRQASSEAKGASITAVAEGDIGAGLEEVVDELGDVEEDAVFDDLKKEDEEEWMIRGKKLSVKVDSAFEKLLTQSHSDLDQMAESVWIQVKGILSSLDGTETTRVLQTWQDAEERFKTEVGKVWEKLEKDTREANDVTVALKEQIKAGYEEELNVLAKFEGKVEEISTQHEASLSSLKEELRKSITKYTKLASASAMGLAACKLIEDEILRSWQKLNSQSRKYMDKGEIEKTVEMQCNYTMQLQRQQNMKSYRSRIRSGKKGGKALEEESEEEEEEEEETIEA